MVLKNNNSQQPDRLMIKKNNNMIALTVLKWEQQQSTTLSPTRFLSRRTAFNNMIALTVLKEQQHDRPHCSKERTTAFNNMITLTVQRTTWSPSRFKEQYDCPCTDSSPFSCPKERPPWPSRQSWRRPCSGPPSGCSSQTGSASAAAPEQQMIHWTNPPKGTKSIFVKQGL